ncbi:RIP metalloprotease RseP [Bernardetia sp.]|uniref:RIP metalloprotease RseP n=1 Tax=Bernardetia sp. TaxID=1937974 RepID=UPI0025C40396|nr:RIP metalloprotease RseP [Bernardetia sp.]
MDIQGIIIGILQLLASLSILVGLHELGHLLAAKYFGVKVEKFSIGFPPKIFGFKYGETEYCLSAIPLGGYVKIAGMIDESLDTEQMSKDPEPWEFRTKPAWQRLIIMLGGIIFNVILGVLIMIAIAFTYGEKYIPIEEVNKYGIEVNDLGRSIGLETGDKIININGEKPKAFKDLLDPSFILNDDSYYTIERNGEQKKIDITSEFLQKYSSSDLKDEEKRFITIREDKYSFAIGAVAPDRNAGKAGLKSKDKVVKVNETTITDFASFQKMLHQNAGKELSFVVERDGKTITLPVSVAADSTIGVGIAYDIDYVERPYTFVESLKVGTETAFGVIGVQAKAYKKMAKGDINASDSLSGPIGMVMIFGTEFEAYRFWRITGFLSMVLALMNLLPIPALDGGHVMFLLYEMITGRPPSDKFLEIAQKVGMVLILCLMIFIFGNDIWKLIKANL